MTNTKWICDICGDTKMPALYTTINKQKACNPCTQAPENKWVGENHWKFADGSYAKKYGVA